MGLTLQRDGKMHQIITEAQVRLSLSEEVVQRMLIVRARRADMVRVARTSRMDMLARPQQVSWETEEV